MEELPRPPSSARVALPALLGCALAAVLWLADRQAGAALGLDPLGRIERISLDARYALREKLKGPPPLPGHISIVAIDAASLETVGRWPWPRGLMAELTSRLSEAGAATLAFDLLFTEPANREELERLRALDQQIQGLGGEAAAARRLVELTRQAADEDLAFAEAIRRFPGPVVLALDLSSAEAAAATGAAPLPQRAILPSIGAAEARSLRPLPAPRLPLPVLTEAAAYLGAVVHRAESDGGMWHEYLVQRHGDQAVPSLALQALRAQKLRQAPDAIALRPGEALLLGPLERGLDRQSRLLLNYYGGEGRFPTWSAAAVLNGRLPPGAVKGHIVLVGATAKGLGDYVRTPYTPELPGVEKHATAIANLAQGGLEPPRFWFGLASIALAGLVVAAATAFAGPVPGALAAALGLALWLVFCQLRFHAGAWVEFTPPALSLVLSAGLAFWRGYRYERGRRTLIQGMFAHYLAKDVVNELIRNPEKARLGGARKEITIFFSDVAGFTRISEQLDTDTVEKIVNDYLDRMTRVIIGLGGTLDKYEGDLIMAFWGAPVASTDHAQRAVAAALENQRRLVALRAEYKRRGWPELYARIGINTGTAHVGNMGSSLRFDYTAMGDTINLGSRLEGTNKFYHTSIIVSETTYRAAPESFEYRQLDRVRVVGRAEAVTIYEPLAEKGQLDEAHRQLVAIYHDALELYRKRDFDRASRRFFEACRLDEHDGPAHIMLKRCHGYLEKAPPDYWDGTYVLDEK